MPSLICSLHFMVGSQSALHPHIPSFPLSSWKLSTNVCYMSVCLHIIMMVHVDRQGNKITDTVIVGILFV